MKRLFVCLFVALLLTGCSYRLVAVKIIIVNQATSGLSGQSAYTVAERLDTHERVWVNDIFGKEGETAMVAENGLHHFL